MGSQLHATHRIITKLSLKSEKKKNTIMSFNYLSRYPFALQDKYSRVDAMCDILRRSCRAKSEMDGMLMDSMEVDKDRFHKEFLSPRPATNPGYYYPKFEVSEAGSPHVLYLPRPYLNYRTHKRLV